MSRLTTAAKIWPGEEEEESISCAVLNASVAPGCREMGSAGDLSGVIERGACRQPGCKKSSITTGRDVIVFTLVCTLILFQLRDREPPMRPLPLAIVAGSYPVPPEHLFFTIVDWRLPGMSGEKVFDQPVAVRQSRLTGGSETRVRWTESGRLSLVALQYRGLLGEIATGELNRARWLNSHRG